MLRKAVQGYRQAVRRPAFRRFWLGMMISRVGDAFTVVALSWVVLGIAAACALLSPVTEVAEAALVPLLAPALRAAPRSLTRRGRP